MKSRIVAVAVVLFLSLVLHLVFPGPSPEEVQAFVKSEAYQQQESAWLKSQLGQAWLEEQGRR